MMKYQVTDAGNSSGESLKAEVITVEFLLSVEDIM